jgi:Na+-driven multidrug efflux pump
LPAVSFSYSKIFFGGALTLWLLGSLTAIIRSTGATRTPARIAVYRAALDLPPLAAFVARFGPEALAGYGLASQGHAPLVFGLLRVAIVLCGGWLVLQQ